MKKFFAPGGDTFYGSIPTPQVLEQMIRQTAEKPFPKPLIAMHGIRSLMNTSIYIKYKLRLPCSAMAPASLC